MNQPYMQNFVVNGLGVADPQISGGDYFLCSSFGFSQLAIAQTPKRIFLQNTSKHVVSI